MTITLVPLRDLRPHERISGQHLAEIERDLLREGVVRNPIIADSRSLVILDGHHRYNALRCLGCKYAPVCLVDYRSTDVKVEAWRKGEHVTKQEVLAAGLSGQLLPARTSRHIFPEVPAGVRVPLGLLREENHAD